MELREQQMLEKNRVAKNCGLALGLVVLSYSIMAQIVTPRIDLGRILRYLVCILIIVVNPILFAKFGKKDKYRIHIVSLLMLLYVVTIITTSVTEMYSLALCSLFIVLSYGDRKMTNICAVITPVALLIAHGNYVLSGEISAVTLGMELGATLVASALTVFISKMQRGHRQQDLEAVQEGALAQVETSKEIIKLASDLNEKFVVAKDVSLGLNESMETTHTSVMEIVEGTKSTAEAIELQTSQTADISEAIAQVGEESKHIGEISARVEGSVAEGVAIIERLKNSAKEVAEINIETRETTETLNNSIQDVQAITQTILGISSQTNLLALNASIEAARAGEAGKGFAVVADEIRALSESTREATEQISDIITRLTKDAQMAADAMARSADVAQTQNDLISETGAKLDDINEESHELHEGVLQVNDSVDSVIAANTVIMDSITNLSATSEEVAASTDTVLTLSDTAIEALHEMNKTLEEISDISGHMENVASN